MVEALIGALFAAIVNQFASRKTALKIAAYIMAVFCLFLFATIWHILERGTKPLPWPLSVPRERHLKAAEARYNELIELGVPEDKVYQRLKREGY